VEFRYELSWVTFHLEVESLIETGCCLFDGCNFEFFMKTDVCDEPWCFGDHAKADELERLNCPKI